MRISLLLVFSLLLGSLSGVWAADMSLAAVQETHQLLQAEYELAKAQETYLLVDLHHRQLHLKSSGLLLESWPIVAYRRWGHPAALPSVPLERKSSGAPERELQVVNSTRPAPPAASKPGKALELADMPTTYRLHLANGTAISVRPTLAGWSGHLRGFLAVPAWYLGRPLISNWNFLRGSPYNELALTLAAQHARQLYWSFSEGAPCLIRLPSAGADAAATTDGTKR